MANHSSATLRRETSHANRTTRTNTIINALTQRAQSLLNDKSIDEQSRAILRHALETNDPWLAEMVRRADAGETIVETTDDVDASREKIEALADIICGAGSESAAALLVLMGTLQNCDDPTALANTVKHFAFTRCGELNVFGMVDAQIAVLQSQLLT
ncbi:MAG TPA: hypothetical protein VLB46_20200 [Pyrinomonadaceae bacterium]|nr:hypothetical protein [Pyrinomonadaceae bacterium]